MLLVSASGWNPPYTKGNNMSWTTLPLFRPFADPYITRSKICARISRFTKSYSWFTLKWWNPALFFFILLYPFQKSDCIGEPRVELFTMHLKQCICIYIRHTERESFFCFSRNSAKHPFLVFTIHTVLF